ncbi:hypothetical protein MMSR116_24085 [Methylobacterium mesophilicum SR1.6/6]|uniref:Uncharacterized protein n=1 Tax=Methylobacterium mesophilicum SR1.6/6 TaxID=908290 RepID=A0A6B9FSC2_9HYPH|nr:hypothetical protein [Methylobacterium mesophilicum]QGY04646.1 hypothetical protein MMSR116_24085 [Methylobacterium mesophilicum SR1.6/6]
MRGRTFGMFEGARSGSREARRAAALQLFVRRGRSGRGTGGRDPNDRAYDLRMARAVERMNPERGDAPLRMGEDEEPASARAGRLADIRSD